MRQHAISTVQRDGARGPAVCADPFEQHFEPSELAALWRLNSTTIRRMFQDHPGVLKIGKSNRRDGKRDYITLRIPKSVAERVYREKSK